MSAASAEPLPNARVRIIGVEVLSDNRYLLKKDDVRVSATPATGGGRIAKHMT